VGIVDHHLHDVDERRLQGGAGTCRGRRRSWSPAPSGWPGLPPFGTFLGKAVMEEAALEAGVPWLIGLFVVRGRAHLGRPAAGARPGSSSASGPPAAEPHAPLGARRGPGTTTGGRIPPSFARLSLLLAGAWPWGWRRGIIGAAQEAAEHFTDRPAYVGRRARGRSRAGPGRAPPAAPARWRPGAVAVPVGLLGLGLALAALRPDRLPEAAARPPVTRLWTRSRRRLRAPARRRHRPTR
jgi:multicomponent Na+:H+ antiporter subunit D